MKRAALQAGFVLAMTAIVGPAAAGDPPEPVTDGVGVEERLGAAVPLDLALVSPSGAQTTLRRYFAGSRPAILVLAYSDCPMLCNLVLRGVAQAIRGTRSRPGSDFDVITVSIDPEESPETAASTQRALAAAAGFPGEPEKWQYFLATEATSGAIAEAVGFRYEYDARTDQYAHPAVVFVLTPEGLVSQYLYGMQLAPEELDEALALAASGRQRASTAIRGAATCFRFDPASTKYAGSIRLALRLTGLLAVGGLLTGIVLISRRRSPT